IMVLVSSIVCGGARIATAQSADLDPRIVTLVAAISEERLGAILKKLGSFETRSTLSSTASTTRGIGAAREWILQEMRSYSPNAPLDNLAPGVNDDGSGTALTIELARVFSQSGIDFEATLVFMCHVGEEQGLVGASLHAQKAVAENIPIEAILNNDIVGNDKG